MKMALKFRWMDKGVNAKEQLGGEGWTERNSLSLGAVIP
jgi:hypothetical protein